ncbi:MAG: VOC family protein [Myxococcota bacterium]
MKNAITWFEIFVSDMDRAARFYESAFQLELKREIFFGKPFGVFPADEEGISGALVYDPARKPSEAGTLLYLPVDDVDATLKRVSAQGGRTVQPKTSIGEFGTIAVILDSEGNAVGLHQR